MVDMKSLLAELVSGKLIIVSLRNLLKVLSSNVQTIWHPFDALANHNSRKYLTLPVTS